MLCETSGTLHRGIPNGWIPRVACGSEKHAQDLVHVDWPEASHTGGQRSMVVRFVEPCHRLGIQGRFGEETILVVFAAFGQHGIRRASWQPGRAASPVQLRERECIRSDDAQVPVTRECCSVPFREYGTLARANSLNAHLA